MAENLSSVFNSPIAGMICWFVSTEVLTCMGHKATSISARFPLDVKAAAPAPVVVDNNTVFPLLYNNNNNNKKTYVIYTDQRKKKKKKKNTTVLNFKR